MREYIIKFENDVPISELASGTTIRALIKITGNMDEIIRCKDCASRGMKDDSDCYCRLLERWNSVNFYCGYGTRKEE